jgi:hypothetical protein
MAEIVETVEIIKDGNPSGRYRRTVRSDEDKLGRFPLCDCEGGHASHDEAASCPKAKHWVDG